MARTKRDVPDRTFFTGLQHRAGVEILLHSNGDVTIRKQTGFGLYSEALELGNCNAGDIDDLITTLEMIQSMNQGESPWETKPLPSSVPSGAN